MHEENIVRDLEVSEGSRTRRATYFVEHGVLHANVEGRTILLPIGSQASEEMVRRLLIGQIQTKTWRERMVAGWRRSKDHG